MGWANTVLELTLIAAGGVGLAGLLLLAFLALLVPEALEPPPRDCPACGAEVPRC